VSGFFTYSAALTLTAFDALLAAVDTTTSAFGSNTASGGEAGSTPNELLSVDAVGGITSLKIEGDAIGGSFVLDDLTFVPLAVPEPRMLGSLLCATAALLAVAARQRWARAV
jgi:hypothetical protein